MTWPSRPYRKPRHLRRSAQRELTRWVLHRLWEEDIHLHLLWDPDEWTLLEHLGPRTGSHHDTALAAWLLRFWPPIYAHALLHGRLSLAETR